MTGERKDAKRCKPAVLALVFIVFLASCGSYNRQISNYYDFVLSSNYKKADETINGIKKMKASRNRLLYLLEKGRMAHLTGQYQNSNRYFNDADLFMEDVRTSVGDVALATLLNPMMQKYKGEDFEKFMVHYYKALNYLYLGETDEALVEARRISLRSYKQQENKTGYSDDAFALMLQGVIYEQGGDINNAFISYRNAAEVYLKNNGLYYGVSIPAQLKKDVLRTAALNGFSSEQERYEKIFGISYDSIRSDGGELILFWENGLAPVKKEQNFMFSLTKDGTGNFVFTDPDGSIQFPFKSVNYATDDNLKLEDLRSLRVAFPKYEEQPLRYHNAIVNVDDAQYPLEKAENINDLAFATLKERFLREMPLTLGRIAVKKLAEQAARPKKDDKDKDTKETVAVALQIFNFASEKADTRNWQTLPHTIFYSRIPLKKGNNSISLQLSSVGQNNKTIEMNVEGTGRLCIKNVCTMR